MFWGLVLEPSKRYTQKVQQAFHVSQAALELSNSTLEPIQLVLDYDGAYYILATLSRKMGIFQVPLDLNFNSGDQISFRTIGKGKIHLSGYHILEEDLEDIALNHDESEIEVGPITDDSENSISGRQKKRNKNTASKNVKNKRRKLSEKNETASDDDSDEGEEEEEEDDDITFNEDMSDSDEEMEEEEEEEEEDDDDDDDEDQEGEDDEEMESDVDQEVFTVPEDDSDEEEEENEKAGKKTPTSGKNNKSDISINGKTPKNKKLNDSVKGGPNKSAKKNASPAGKEAKENRTPKKEKKSPKGEKNKQESSPQKKVLEGGVIIEDMKLGDGPVAKPGKMVQVYYVGRLQSNKKQFDQTVQGPGFKFRLGKGEVIKGWDIGVNGMKVGGKRRITIPSQLAYGPKGAPPAIPPNSVLLFEVELKGVN